MFPVERSRQTDSERWTTQDNIHTMDSFLSVITLLSVQLCSCACEATHAHNIWKTNEWSVLQTLMHVWKVAAALCAFHLRGRDSWKCFLQLSCENDESVRHDGLMPEKPGRDVVTWHISIQDSPVDSWWRCTKTDSAREGLHVTHAHTHTHDTTEFNPIIVLITFPFRSSSLGKSLYIKLVFISSWTA